jgi:RNA polymerase sigma factor (sigma-70 family)
VATLWVATFGSPAALQPQRESCRRLLEASALTHAGAHGHVRGPTPLLRLQSDERLVALTRRGNQAAYEALVGRYQSRLLAFCRHMLSSREDAEDVLQEVFAAAFNAMIADERPLNVRPWLYRIARNRSLNHLRRAQAIGVDSMDVHLSEHGTTTADKVHKREEFRQLMEDVQGLPETQRTALLLREIDALSYEQIAEAMETTVPSIKSLLVRARVSLAEAAEARLLTCEEVRAELGEVAEGLKRTTAPVRRHVRTCERCAAFRKSLRETNKALASVMPVGPLLLLKKLLLAHLGTTASAGAGGGAAAAAGAGAAGAGAGGAVSASMSVVASKAAATVAAAAIVTVGTVEVDQVREHHRHTPARAAVSTPHVAERAPGAHAPRRHRHAPPRAGRHREGLDFVHRAGREEEAEEDRRGRPRQRRHVRAGRPDGGHCGRRLGRDRLAAAGLRHLDAPRPAAGQRLDRRRRRPGRPGPGADDDRGRPAAAAAAADDDDDDRAAGDHHDGAPADDHEHADRRRAAHGDGHHDPADDDRLHRRRRGAGRLIAPPRLGLSRRGRRAPRSARG